MDTHEFIFPQIFLLVVLQTTNRESLIEFVLTMKKHKKLNGLKKKCHVYIVKCLSFFFFFGFLDKNKTLLYFCNQRYNPVLFSIMEDLEVSKL